MIKEKQSHNSTIFDDVFRTMVQKMPMLLIPLINEVFHTDYSEDEAFEQLRNEHTEAFGKVITDSIIYIRGKTYHIECQSNDDATMAIRMIEYDFAIAIEQAVKNGRTYEVDFPDSCVLYLRDTFTTPDVLNVKVKFPNGQYCNYEAKVIKLQNYSKDEILRKKLLFLLPFYIIRYEKQRKEIARDLSKLNDLLSEYEDIRLHLEKELYEKGKSVLYTDLIKLIIKISDYIMQSEINIKEGVSNIVGGNILELESERLEKKGELKMLVKLVKERRISIDVASETANMTEDEFRKLMNDENKD